MKVLKWLVLFALAFMVSWVLIFTFTQDPFKLEVPARILTYNTPAIPIYAYVVAAFGVGLLLGLLVALYYGIVLQAELHRRGRKIRNLEAELGSANQATAGHDQAKEEPPTDTQPADDTDPRRDPPPDTHNSDSYLG